MAMMMIIIIRNIITTTVANVRMGERMKRDEEEDCERKSFYEKEFFGGDMK